LNSRDFLTTAAVGLVLVVGAFAVADSVRGCERAGNEVAPPETPTETAPPATTTGDGPTPAPEAPEGWPQGALRGVLTFVDADSCLVRAIGLGSGRERPLSEYQTECGSLWAPWVGTRIAYELGLETEGTMSFRIVDLAQGPRDLGTYDGAGDVHWSFDAQRVAWCTFEGAGAEREILGEAHPLPFCPLGYTVEGELAHAVGNRLVAGSRTLLTADGVGWARFGFDGSVAVLENRRLLERFSGGESTGSVRLPGRWLGAAPVMSPDNCLAAVPVDTGVRLLSLGCSAVSPQEYPGYAAAWSPLGQWLAIAEQGAIVFRSLAVPDQEIRWPATAAQLAWRSD
jgi:hypothetical protein